ncbi:MAG: hypothetical protein WCS65_17020 [Verrucomicrobiae bacterium]
MKPRLFLLISLVAAQACLAQPAPPAAGTAGAAVPAAAPDLTGIANSISGALPSANPGSEIVKWNGQNWSVTNNRLFESQLEKYLSSPPAEPIREKAYRATLDRINQLLNVYPLPAGNINEAFRLLTTASMYPQDGHMSDVLYNQILMAWAAQKDNTNLALAVQSLEAERKRLEWNLKVATQYAGGLSSQSNAPAANVSKGGGSVQSPGSLAQPAAAQTAEVQPIVDRLAEVQAAMKLDQVKNEISQERARADFSTLLTQFFFQRWFAHLEVGIKFYRSIFGGGQNEMRLGKDALNLFEKTSGNPPTLGNLEAMGRDMSYEADQGVVAFGAMFDNKQLQSASKRLSEAYIVGEHLSTIRQVPLNQKQLVLAFTLKGKKLLSAIQVRNYGLAETLVHDLNELAQDLDTTEADAAINTAKTAADMHIAKARNAAVSGDKATLDTELKAATEIWPTNPQLKEVAAKIFAQADVQGLAISEFDQLISEKNYRRIYDDKMRFIAATAMLPDKQEQLRKVLETMQAVETAIVQASEISKRGDDLGAWENIEAIFSTLPEDNKLNQLRSDLTTKAANFVNAITEAKKLEQNGQTGSALAAYLEARRLYPPSQFAREGIARLSKVVMPDAQ